jgi:DNA polymerase
MNRPRAIKSVLEFYDALGFERLPLSLPEKGISSSGLQKDKAAALERLRRELGECGRCRLKKGCTNVVFGEGSAGAELMFVGEAPGREEDIQGRPFVGEAGKLLTSLINRMGFDREEAYITNVIKCRPPNNRDPQEDEIRQCLPVLKKQIEIISPKVIMTLGRIAAHAVVGVTTPISRLRGKFVKFEGIDLMPTFHPAYLLRNPRDKMLVWADALQVLGKLGREAK